MKKIILVVEDLEKEQAQAKEAVLEGGYKVILASALADAKRLIESVKIAGIITDLHFPESDRDNDRNRPCGLAVVTIAIQRNIPIVICSDLDHHFAHYLLDIISFLESVSAFKRIPTIIDLKDWNRAVNELKKLIK